MLLGEYEHTLDDKNRLTLPAKFRRAFEDGCVVSRGFDGCLSAWTPEGWDNYRGSTLATLNLLSREQRQLHRYLLSGATDTTPDKQGRVLIPPTLLDHAKLGRDVVVAGVNDHLEIWDRDAWRRELSEVEGSAEDVAERLAQRS
ncbi:MAG: transcriptional regulator MraZ [Gaiellaceae bacterium]|jgi:MraZ protein|nr:transcriptional regulator MraZ [Gaiellaceae bacterium]